MAASSTLSQPFLQYYSMYAGMWLDGKYKLGAPVGLALLASLLVLFFAHIHHVHLLWHMNSSAILETNCIHVLEG